MKKTMASTGRNCFLSLPRQRWASVYSGRSDTCYPAPVAAFHSIWGEAVPGYDLLEQGKEQQARLGKTDKQSAGTYGRDGAHLLRHTGHEA